MIVIDRSDQRDQPQPFFLRTPQGVEYQKQTAPTLGEGFAAGFNRENVLVNLFRASKQARYPDELGYNPMKHIQLVDKEQNKQYESKYLGEFVHSTSTKQSEDIMARLDQRDKEDAIYNSSGLPGVVGAVFGGALDPTIFWPGGAILKAREGYSLVRSAMSIGRAAAGQSVAQEALLQATQTGRTVNESVINIEAGTMLGMILGSGAAKMLSRSERKAMTGQLEAARAPQGPVRSGGAAEADTRTMELVPFLPAAISKPYAKARELVEKVPYVGKPISAVMGLPEKIATRMNPVDRTLSGTSLEGKRILGDLAEIPYDLKQHYEGITSSQYGIPLSREVDMIVTRADNELAGSSEKAYAQYRFGNAETRWPVARDVVSRRTGEVDKLDYQKFLEEVDYAIRHGDMHPTIPEAAELAKKARGYMNIVKNRAKELKIEISDDVLGAESFGPRIYPREKMIQNRQLFIERNIRHRINDQEVKRAIQESVRAEFQRFEAAQKAGAQKAMEETRAKLEELVDRWEGNTTAAAKKAIAARREAEKLRSEKQGAGTYQGKGERLKSADSEVEDAVKAILKSDRDQSPQEIAAAAEQTYNEIIGTPDGRLPKDEPGHVIEPRRADETGPMRGSLQHRKLPMTDDDLLPVLERNPLNYIGRYLRQGLTDLGMIERFGDTEMKTAFKRIQDEFDARLRGVTDPNKVAALIKERDRTIEDLSGIRDRLKGIFGFSPDKFMQNAGRIAQSLKNINVSTLGGGFGVAQLPDFAGAVFRYGMTKTFAKGWTPFFNKLMSMKPEYQKAAKQFRAMGIGTETWNSSRTLQMMDLTDTYAPRTGTERVLQGAGKATMVLSGTTHMTDWARTATGFVAADEILRMSQAISQGKATRKQIRNLAAANITPERASSIWAEFSKPGGGNEVDGVLLPNLDQWKNQDASKFFESAVMREVEIAVVNPGQEKPLFLSQPVLSLFGQFKTFTASATSRILLANLQRRDANVLSGLIVSLGLGAISYAIKAYGRGQDLADTPQAWFKEAMDAGGIPGWFGEVNAMTAKATGGKLDLYRLIGADRPLSRYQSRGLIGSLLGPTLGKVEDAQGLTYSLSQGEFVQSDTTRARHLVFFQNVTGLRALFDEVEHGVNDAFGIPKKREAQ